MGLLSLVTNKLFILIISVKFNLKKDSFTRARAYMKIFPINCGCQPLVEFWQMADDGLSGAINDMSI